MLVTFWVHPTQTLTSQQRIKVQAEVNLSEKYCYSGLRTSFLRQVVLCIKVDTLQTDIHPHNGADEGL